MPSRSVRHWPRAYLNAWARWKRTDPPCASVLAGDQDAPDYHLGVLVQRASAEIYAAALRARQGNLEAVRLHSQARAALAELERAVAQMPDVAPELAQWCAQSRDILDRMPMEYVVSSDTPDA